LLCKQSEIIRLFTSSVFDENIAMKLMKSMLLAVALIGSASADVAWASHGQSHFTAHRSVQRHGGWGHSHGYYWRGGFYGAAWPWFYPWYYGYAVPVFPDSLYPEPEAPVEYVEMNPAQPPDTSANVWYYCQNPQGYYPYVKSCADGWQKVPVQPSK
jgi:hypothetical protein